jgi:Domain of unknown function (DUF4160)
MPTILRSGPYRFFFYAGDRDEPVHVHVERDDSEAKFWLDPIRLERSRGFARKEINQIQTIIEENQQILLDQWHEYFSG